MKILTIFAILMSFAAFAGEIVPTELQGNQARPSYRYSSCQMFREGDNFHLRKVFEYCWRSYERRCTIDSRGYRRCYHQPVTHCNKDFERHVFDTPVVFENGAIVVRSRAGDTVIGKHYKKFFTWWTVLDNNVVSIRCDSRNAYLDLH